MIDVSDGVPPSSNIDGKLAEFSAVCDEMHLLLVCNGCKKD